MTPPHTHTQNIPLLSPFRHQHASEDSPWQRPRARPAAVRDPLHPRRKGSAPQQSPLLGGEEQLPPPQGARGASHTGETVFGRPLPHIVVSVAEEGGQAKVSLLPLGDIPSHTPPSDALEGASCPSPLEGTLPVGGSPASLPPTPLTHLMRDPMVSEGAAWARGRRLRRRGASMLPITPSRSGARQNQAAGRTRRAGNGQRRAGSAHWVLLGNVVVQVSRRAGSSSRRRCHNNSRYANWASLDPGEGWRGLLGLVPVSNG